jgi:hypothetical protein
LKSTKMKVSRARQVYSNCSKSAESKLYFRDSSH